MTSRQTAAICATILLAAVANMAGGFAIQFYFSGRQSVEMGRQLARTNPGLALGEPRFGGSTATTSGLPAIGQFPDDGSMDLVPLPPPGSEADEFLGTLIGDGVGQPADVRDGLRFRPRELPDANHAAPIQPRPLLDERVIMAIIKSELPDATADEREVWKKQLIGLEPNEIRILLQMRRRFGSEIPESLELSLPSIENLGTNDVIDNEPVVAPVPMTGE